MKEELPPAAIAGLGATVCAECPPTMHERILRFVEKNGVLNPERAKAGALWGVDSVHARLHDYHRYRAEIDVDTASWESSLAGVFMEFLQKTEDAKREARGDAWEFEDGKVILWRPDGISLRLDRGKHPVVLPVIAGFLKPERAVVVEGWTYFEVLITPSERVTASFTDLLKRLERDGRIRKRKLGSDVLAEVLAKMAPPAGAAFPTYGILTRDGVGLEVCKRPVPVRDEQLQAHTDIEKGLELAPTKEALEAYIRFVSHYHAYETLPAMGLAAIAPVAYLLRSYDIFVPHVWHWALAHGLGKSLVAVAFSQKLWGRQSTTGSAINSEFRFSAHMDAAAVPQAVEEGEKLDVRRLGPLIKASAERPVVTRRGTTVLTMTPFGSRAILFVSGNRLAPRSGPALARFLAPRFDSGQAATRREHKAEIDRINQSLLPIGHFVAEQLLALHGNLPGLLERVRDIEAAIARTGAAQSDIRRPQSWAVVYVGLEAWKAALDAFGVAWELPSIPRFVEEVVIPVDTATFEGEETVVTAFRSWFEVWRARNVRKVTNVSVAGGREQYSREEEVAGKGALFEDATLEIPPGTLGGEKRRLQGWYVTPALITEYNRTADSDLNIGSLRELAAAAADEAGIPHDLVLDGKGQARVVAFGQRGRIRAAFVARDLEGD